MADGVPRCCDELGKAMEQDIVGYDSEKGTYYMNVLLATAGGYAGRINLTYCPFCSLEPHLQRMQEEPRLCPKCNTIMEERQTYESSFVEYRKYNEKHKFYEIQETDSAEGPVTEYSCEKCGHTITGEESDG